MTAEVERARRYHHELGLIMLDIDNFKQVNDTYGHLHGDMVLREVARVLRQSSRDVDEPARYGGEEMAVALPQTDLEGAYQFAERVRRRIEALELPLPDGHEGVLRVTASFGADVAGRDRRRRQGHARRGRGCRAVPGKALWARTAPSGPRRRARRTASREGSSLGGEAWDCSTTPSASTSSSSASTAAIRPRSSARRARPSAPLRAAGGREAAAAAGRDDTAEHPYDDGARGRGLPDAGPRPRSIRRPPSRARGLRRRRADDGLHPGRARGGDRADEIEPPAGEEEVPSAGHEADAPGYDEDPWLDEPSPSGAARPPAPEEDVLEETPDFLQETPEHDRLWFEQKPPRGFDWDR